MGRREVEVRQWQAFSREEHQGVEDAGFGEETRRMRLLNRLVSNQ
jgi:hypothetical protein